MNPIYLAKHIDLVNVVNALLVLADPEGVLSCIPEGPERNALQAALDKVVPRAQPLSDGVEQVGNDPSSRLAWHRQVESEG